MLIVKISNWPRHRHQVCWLEPARPGETDSRGCSLAIQTLPKKISSIQRQHLKPALVLKFSSYSEIARCVGYKETDSRGCSLAIQTLQKKISSMQRRHLEPALFFKFSSYSEIARCVGYKETAPEAAASRSRHCKRKFPQCKDDIWNQR